MFRAPSYCAALWFAGLLAQLTDGQGWGVHETSYVIFGVLVVPAFTAVWAKLWLMHATILNGKDERIAKLEAEDAEKEKRIAKLEAEHAEKDARIDSLVAALAKLTREKDTE